MRFNQMFKRDKGAALNPALGTDVLGTSAAPVFAGGLAAAVTGAPNAVQTAPYRPAPGAPTTNDGSGTVLSCPFKTVDGWPVQRIAVLCVPTWAAPGATTAALTANGYLYDHLTSTWQKANASPVAITPGVLAYFDPCALAAQSQQQAQMGTPSSGAIEFLLEVLDGGATSNGTFAFAMAPCTTEAP